MGEFDIIKRYFAPLSLGELDNDGAVIDVPEGHQLVVTTDTLNEDTHFLGDMSAQSIAHKALRVNLSDLAAMGAEPLAYQLAIAFPMAPDAKWLQDFTAALAADQKAFGIHCSGGDTTTIDGPLSISITAMGTVPKGKSVLRSGAKDGDVLMLTGPVGDAWLGLKVRQEGWEFDGAELCVQAYEKPLPQVALAALFQKHAHAALDVSDGLVADVGHLTAASKLRAVIDVSKVPVSEAAKAAMTAGLCTFKDLVTGGDDYQVAFAVAAADVKHFPACTEIGYFEAGQPGVDVVDGQGNSINVDVPGWQHF